MLAMATMKLSVLLLFAYCICVAHSKSTHDDHDNIGEDTLVSEVLTEIRPSFPQTSFEDLKEIYMKWLDVEWKKPYDQFKTRQAFKKFVLKAASKLSERAGHSGVKTLSLNAIKLVANHPLGYVADVAQCVLEIAGHDTAGKWVGAIGNAAAGYVVAGPVGAAVGLGFWYFGEIVEYETAQYLKKSADYLDYLPMDYFKNV